MTAAVVTPNIDATTIGRFSPSGGTLAPAMPARAPAALAMIRADTSFTPAMSTTEYIIVTSTEPTYGPRVARRDGRDHELRDADRQLPHRVA